MGLCSEAAVLNCPCESEPIKKHVNQITSERGMVEMVLFLETEMYKGGGSHHIPMSFTSLPLTESTDTRG